MKSVVYEEFSTGIGTVGAIYSNYRPDVENVIETDASLPVREEIPGMSAYLRINLESGDLYYDYIAVETVDQKIADLNQTIGTLLLESANDKATIASLEETVGTLLFEVAALKGGSE